MKRNGWWTGPVALATLAVLMGAFPILRPSAGIDLGRLDLHAEATTEASFDVHYNGLYSIGVAMNQHIAKRLFPCVVDPEFFEFGQAACKASRTTKKWPLQLSLTMTGDRRDVAITTEPKPDAGGAYEGDDIYIWDAALVHLRPGVHYRLSIVSMKDGMALVSSRPRLVVYEADPGFRDREAIMSEAAYAAAAMIGLAAMTWFVIAFRSSKRSRTSP